MKSIKTKVKDPHGLNQRQRLFVEYYTSGMAAGRAYEAAGYVAKGDSADANGCRMIGNDKVSKAITDAQKTMQDTGIITKQEMIEFLLKVLNSKPSEAALDNPLCEIKMSMMGPYAVFPDKSACIEKLIRMLGFYAPEKLEVTLDPMSEFIKRLRSGGTGG